jgi:outer membrane protein W
VDPADGLLDRSRHRSIGAAAELGAAWRVSNSLALAADVHWVDLASNADMLRVGNSMVAADSVALGVSLGWRFK